MSKSNSRIIEKMKKLLVMAEGKANENEAMTTARQLHVFMPSCQAQYPNGRTT